MDLGLVGAGTSEAAQPQVALELQGPRDIARRRCRLPAACCPCPRRSPAQAASHGITVWRTQPGGLLAWTWMQRDESTVAWVTWICRATLGDGKSHSEDLSRALTTVVCRQWLLFHASGATDDRRRPSSCMMTRLEPLRPARIEAAARLRMLWLASVAVRGGAMWLGAALVPPSACYARRQSNLADLLVAVGHDVSTAG